MSARRIPNVAGVSHGLIKPLATLTAMLCLSASMQSMAATATLISNATVITDRVQTNTDLLIQDGKVRSIGEARTMDLPEAITRVDGTGHVITAGLFLAHTQLGLDEIDLETTTIDSRLDATGVGPAFDVQYAFNPASVVTAVNLVEGVTHGVIAPRAGPDPLAGVGAAVDYANGRVIQPRLAMYADIGARMAPTVGGSRAETLGRLRRTLTELPSLRVRSYIPGRGGYSRQDVTALKNALADELPFVVEAHRAADIRQVLRLASDFDLRVILRGATEAWQVAAELAEADVPVILDPLENLPLSFEQLGARLDNAALLHTAGVKLAIVVSDFHNARLVRQHAGNAVSYGLDWLTGVHAITRAPAELFGLSDVGVLEEGAPATLVVWSGDPLEVTTYARHVYVDGEPISLESRQTKLLERYRDLSVDHPSMFKYNSGGRRKGTN